MQEWLNDRKLDRKALTGLSANLAAVEAWEEYVLEEAEAVVRSLVAAVAGEPEDQGEAEEDGSERPPGGSVSASDVEDGDAAAEGICSGGQPQNVMDAERQRHAAARVKRLWESSGCKSDGKQGRMVPAWQ